MNTEFSNIIEEEVHISQIQPGDTIFYDNKVRTVCKKDIKHGGFCGTTIFGDSFISGRKKVTKILFYSK